MSVSRGTRALACLVLGWPGTRLAGCQRLQGCKDGLQLPVSCSNLRHRDGSTGGARSRFSQPSCTTARPPVAIRSHSGRALRAPSGSRGRACLEPPASVFLHSGLEGVFQHGHVDDSQRQLHACPPLRRSTPRPIACCCRGPCSLRSRLLRHGRQGEQVKGVATRPHHPIAQKQVR